MTFTVVWTPSALGRLAELWMAAERRESLARASDFIDSALRVAPLEYGKAKMKGHRTLICVPLGVDYFVSVDDRKVTVVDVWKIEGFDA